MKTIKDIMTTDVVWISPTARVKTAVNLMKSQNIGALPVVSANDAVGGLVTYQSVLGEPQDAAVTEVMETDLPIITSEKSLRDAAEVLGETHSDHLLVMQENRLAGIISATDLLPELGRNFDPLTGLSWSDAFREWGISALKSGTEISIVFFDLDNFGHFNKQFGHVIGDKVLVEVAEVVKASVDLQTDLPCRYGGDEFAIVSTRNADEAQTLAESIRKSITQISIPDLPEGISGTYGIFGGRRTKEREDMHFAATMDDLITRASKECMGKKAARIAAQSVPRPDEGSEHKAGSGLSGPKRSFRLKIQTIGITTTGAEAKVDITLARGEQEYSREVSGYIVEGKNLLRLVAEATAGAACKSIASDHGIAIEDVWVTDNHKGDEIVTVVAIFITPRYTTRHAGSAVIKRGDSSRAAAAALMSAINRQIEFVPQASPEQTEEAPLASAGV